MAVSQEVIIRTILTGAREVVAAANSEAAALLRLRGATDAAEEGAAGLSASSFVASQALFTARRVAYGTTFALLGLGYAALKVGWSYENAMNTASVALQPVFHSQQALNKELADLYRIAAFTPFHFQDVTVGFRQMYAAFQPLGISAHETNVTMQALMDALSYAGKSTPAALNRVTVALQHIAFLGHVTGQQVTQLARDGLPIYAALRKELGLTGDQIHKIGTLAITPLEVIKALQVYIRTTPGYADAALRQSNKTLVGAMQTTRDLISQALGGALGGTQGQGGVFNSVREFFFGINQQLGIMAKQGRPISLMTFMEAVDKIASPHTHAVLLLFSLLSGLLQGVATAFWLASRAAWIFIGPIWALYQVLSLVGIGTKTVTGDTKLLGWVLGILIGEWIVYRGVMMSVAIVTVLYNLVMGNVVKTSLVLRAVTFLLNISMIALRTTYTTLRLIMLAVWGYMNRLVIASILVAGRMWLVSAATAAYEATLVALELWQSRVIVMMMIATAWAYRLGIAQIILAARTWLTIVAMMVWDALMTEAAVVTFFFIGVIEALSAAFAVLWVALGPIGWIIIGIGLLIVGLTVLYFKWRWFHNAVNDTWNWIRDHWPMLIAILIGPWAIAAYMIYKYLDKIKGYITDFYNWMKDKGKNLGESIGKRIMDTLMPGSSSILSTASKLIPGLASGGYVRSGGLTLVGEYGPELLSLPAGASVVPYQNSSQLGGGLGGMLNIHVYPQDIYIDGKKLATALARVVTDTQARQ
jgi:hypothetical protein